MSFKALLKNVYTYANILCQAESEAVLKWDDKTLEKAFNWAKYCQQAYKEIIGQPFEEEVDRHIKGLVIYLQPVSCLHEFDLKSLENASDKLLEILIQNPLTNNKLLEQLIKFKLGTDGEVNVESLIQICTSPATQLAAAELLEEVADQCNCPVSGLGLQAQANVLLQSLKHQFIDSSSDRFESYLNKLLERILKSSEGLEVIIRMLISDNDCLSNYTVDDIPDFQRLHTLIVAFMQHNISGESLLSVDKSLLCQVSSLCPAVEQMYIQSLTEIAKQMQPCYGTDIGVLYTWRNKDDHQGRHSFTYEDLLEHFKNLNRSSVETSVKLIQFLRELSMDNFVNIYKDILKYLEKN